MRRLLICLALMCGCLQTAAAHALLNGPAQSWLEDALLAEARAHSPSLPSDSAWRNDPLHVASNALRNSASYARWYAATAMLARMFQTYVAASCARDDVQAKLDLATAASDIVEIPSCPAGVAWTSAISWAAPANAVLRGAGSTSIVGGNDRTVIVDNFASSAPLVSLSSNAGTFRVHGITFRGGTGSVHDLGLMFVGGSSTQVRIDHIHFAMREYAGAYTSRRPLVIQNVYGVADHNLFDNIANGSILFLDNDEGDTTWSLPSGHGGRTFFFLEDNRWTNDDDGAGNYAGAMTDCHTGGKFVVRYNTGEVMGVGQTHPTSHGAGHDRGCRAHEVYGNTIIAGDSGFNPAVHQPSFTFAFMTSGTGLFWGNTASNVLKSFLYTNVTRRNADVYVSVPTPNGWGYCGTQFSGTGSAWDGNTPSAVIGYPCIDQPGRGQGDLLTGDFPTEVNSRTGTIAWPNQVLEPVREWLNTYAVVYGWGCGVKDGPLCGFRLNLDPSRIAVNRDIYYYTASFDGTAGVGVGVIASRPATCTAGVAYWATNEGEWNSSNGATADGKMYVCTALNTWTARYGDVSNVTGLPYAYPHPLIALTGR